jgi:hypothetical protein
VSIVDIHAHHHSGAYTAALARLYPGLPPRVFGEHPDTDDEEHVAARLAMMDAAGVSLQVLSPAALRAPYGIDEHAAVLGRSVAEDEFLPIYEEIDRRGGVVFFHPCANGICSPMITDYGLTGAVGTSLVPGSDYPVLLSFES